MGIGAARFAEEDKIEEEVKLSYKSPEAQERFLPGLEEKQLIKINEICKKHQRDFDYQNSEMQKRFDIRWLDFEGPIEHNRPNFKERLLIISKQFIFLFLIEENNGNPILVAKAEFKKEAIKGIKHKIIMPKDYSKDTGCFILNTDLIHYEKPSQNRSSRLSNVDNASKDQKKSDVEIGRSKYLFYQVIHKDAVRTHSKNSELRIFIANQLSEKFKITERQEIILKRQYMAKN